MVISIILLTKLTALKVIFLIIFLAAAINPARTQHSVIIKATIYLINHNKISGKIINTNDDGLIVFTGDTASKFISATDIHFIRVKRHGLEKGLAYGVVIGGAIGYAAGWVTYEGDDYDYDEDPPDQTERAWLGAMIGAVPGAVVGSITGGIFTKRRFKIEGDKENLRRMFEEMWRAER